MKLKINLILLLMVCAILVAQTISFIDQQKKYPRVRNAFSEKEVLVVNKFKNKNINIKQAKIFIRVFKQENILEIWGCSKSEQNYQLIETYSICAKSGNLGPKEKQGDYQVPEGFYHVDRFNPASSFLLSLGINYPNTLDKKYAQYIDKGGDIFIHGSCVSIGCMAMEDEAIKEIYLMAVYGKQNVGHIPVSIFPFKFTQENKDKFFTQYQSNYKLINFWKNLEEGYCLFEKYKKIPNVNIKNSTYEFTY